MSEDHYEPFGEAIAEPVLAKASSSGSGRALTVVGACVFWMLVVVILGARIALFNHSFSETAFALLSSVKETFLR